ncbi:PqqD family protein [Sphingobacterium sp. HJSM2_6]|uniref:PqqD family protein n=1 Tax=Sphingobacterium sp. HJSM2_6 TaxID=3366264 RepID=UPI003BD0E08E
MKLRKDLILRQVGDDFVIVEPDQGVMDFSKVFTLNNSAAWLWDKLQGIEFEYQDIFKLLLEEYEVKSNQYDSIEEDVKKLIADFEHYNLIEKN